MKTRSWKPVGLAVIVAATGNPTNAAVPSVTSIGVLDGANPESAVYAITGDGEYAAGYSTAQNSDQTAVIRQPVFWSAATGLVQLPNPAPNGPGSDIDGEARGIVYRPLHPTTSLGITGSIPTINEYDPEYPTIVPVMQFYLASLTNPAGGQWLIGDANNKLNSLGAFNAARPQTASGTTSEGWYIVGKRRITLPGSCTDPTSQCPHNYCTCNNRPYRLRVNPVGYADWYPLWNPDCEARRGDLTDCCPDITYQMANSVDSSGRAVGFDDGNWNCTNQHRALWYNIINYWPMVIPGGSQILSEGLGISADGDVVSGFDASVISESTPVESKAFIWRALPDTDRDPAMRLLDNLPGDTQGCAIAVTTYETAGGYSSDGTTERAVIWDSSGMWDTTGEPKLLSDLLIGQGVDLSEWASLTRVTSISDNGQTVAGWGVWAADDSKRGFLAVSGNAVGACCMRTSLGTGTCIPGVTSGICDLQGGDYLGDDSDCGTDNRNCDFCGSPWADIDLDQDVDMNDFAVFQLCIGATTPLSIECGCFDRGAESPGVIGSDDLERFVNCGTGPDVPYVTNPACEP